MLKTDTMEFFYITLNNSESLSGHKNSILKKLFFLQLFVSLESCLSSAPKELTP